MSLLRRLPTPLIRPGMIRRVVVRGVVAWFLAALSVVIALIVTDAWRRRTLIQGRLRRSRPTPVPIGDSELQVYTYGEFLFEAMLEAIQGARTQILFETYIWKGDAVGERFKRALEQAAERGVEVYVIFDTFANLVVPPAFKRFSPRLHVLAYPILPAPLHPLQLRNYARDHRKILVVDGETAFVGGYNVGRPYATDWRDTHLRITGPDAGELENLFVDFWNGHRGSDLPELPDRGSRSWDPRITLHRNDPQLFIFPIRTMYLEAIDRAHHHIFLTHAYFVPDAVILRALLDAARRGVDVRILLPERSNHIVVDWLAHGFYAHCLAGGIKLLLYQNAMVHAKTATIDGIWSTIGTANLDRLSLVGNFEVNVEVYGEPLAMQMEAVFLEDAANCRELTLDEWIRRSLITKISERILLPLRPLL